jgi:hypothetical protein
MISCARPGVYAVAEETRFACLFVKTAEKSRSLAMVIGEDKFDPKPADGPSERPVGPAVARWERRPLMSRSSAAKAAGASPRWRCQNREAYIYDWRGMKILPFLYRGEAFFPAVKFLGTGHWIAGTRRGDQALQTASFHLGEMAGGGTRPHAFDETGSRLVPPRPVP